MSDLGFGGGPLFSNTRNVQYPLQQVRGPPGSLRPINSIILFYDDFSGSQVSWNQAIFGGTLSTKASFVRKTTELAFDTSNGALHVYAGTAAGTGNNLTGASPTCDVRRYSEYQGAVQLGCEIWFTFLAQMSNEEGLIGIALSQMDGVLDRRLQVRFDMSNNLTRTDYETTQGATAYNQMSFKTLTARAKVDGYASGKWSHLLLEADFSTNTILRAIFNNTDYSPALAGISLTTQGTSVASGVPFPQEGAKAGIAAYLFNQATPLRGAEYFIGAALLYKIVAS